MDKSGIITKVYESDFATPILCVLKSDESFRICVDFLVTLNNCMNTVKNPLPSFDEVINQMGDAKVFSKIDL